MSLCVVSRHEENNNKQLTMYVCGTKYSIKYKNNNQNITLKSDITDEGYANYLFDIYLEDFNMVKNNNNEIISFLKDNLNIRLKEYQLFNSKGITVILEIIDNGNKIEISRDTIKI